jgi:hypothetical protein
MITNNKRVRVHLVALVVALVFMISSVQSFAGTVNLVETNIVNGQTMLWRPTNNTNGWHIAKGTSVELYFALKSAETNVHYGLRNSSGKYIKFGGFSGSSTSRATSTVSAAAYYKVYLTNNSAGTIRNKASSYIRF